LKYLIDHTDANRGIFEELGQLGDLRRGEMPSHLYSMPLLPDDGDRYGRKQPGVSRRIPPARTCHFTLWGYSVVLLPPGVADDTTKEGSRLPTTAYQVKGMTCEHCVRAVRSELSKVDGVEAVEVDLATGRVTVSSRSALHAGEVAGAVNEAGYELVG
jgi:copper chaperone CopZ